MNTSLSAPPSERLESTTLSDDLLTEWLGSNLGSRTKLGYVHSGHTVKFFEVDGEGIPFQADPGKASLKVLKAIAKLGLLSRLELSTEQFDAAIAVVPSWPLLAASQTDVCHLIRTQVKRFQIGALDKRSWMRRIELLRHK